MNDVRHPATDAARHHINFRFAELLKEYIILKGDECMLTRDTESLADPGITKYVNKYNITVYITVDMYTDIDPKAQGYDILCDSYNSLVATFNYELYKQDRKPIRDLGYRVTNASRISDFSDITLYLGYATNEEELTWWNDEDHLEQVAKRLIEGAYGPPVKTIEDTDQTGNNDPYFYGINTWKESAEIDGCSAKIEETLYTGLPLRYLSIESNAEIGEYTWETPSTYERDTMCVFIGSLRSHGSSPTCYIKIGNTEYTEVILDTTFSIKVFEGTVGPGTPIKLGVKGKGRIDYSGIWVSPKGSMGALDDPRTDYSIFPPGYRPVNKVTSAYNTADAIHIALTTAHTLLERAQDSQSSGVTTTMVNLDASTGVANDRGSASTDFANIINSGVSVALKVANYASALAAVMEIFSNKSEQKAAVTDPKNQKTDYAALQSAVGSVRSFEDKAKIQSAVNDIEGMSRAVDTAMDGDYAATETATLALNDATSVKKKLEEGTTTPDPNSASPIDTAKEEVATAAKRETAVITQVTSNKTGAWGNIETWCLGKLILTIQCDAVDDEEHQTSSLYGVPVTSWRNASGNMESSIANRFNSWAKEWCDYRVACIPPTLEDGTPDQEFTPPPPPTRTWDDCYRSIPTEMEKVESDQLQLSVTMMPQELLSSYATQIGMEYPVITNVNAIADFLTARKIGGYYRLRQSGKELANSYVLKSLKSGSEGG